MSIDPKIVQEVLEILPKNLTGEDFGDLIAKIAFVYDMEPAMVALLLLEVSQFIMSDDYAENRKLATPKAH